MLSFAAATPSAFWYMTRGTGTIALILLTVSLALGVVNVRRARTPSVPRFVFVSVHRNASLLAVAFVCVHILTALLDGYAPIRLIDVVVPFGSAYRPLWLGFGAAAFDLLIAVALTSLLRRRLGYGAWRATHWLAYASWPVAVLHGLGTGSDTKLTWMLALTGACVVTVIVSVVARVTAGWPDHLGARVSALAASALVPIGLLVWLPSGPLAAGWAKRAGTPSSLLAGARGAVSTGAVAGGGTGNAGGGAGVPAAGSGATAAGAGAPARAASSSPSFSARVTGTVRQGKDDDGLTVVDIVLHAAGPRLSRLEIRIVGSPIAGGGVEMRASRVALGPASAPEQYRGVVTALHGTEIAGAVRDASGAAVALLAQLQIDPGSSSVTGTLTTHG